MEPPELTNFGSLVRHALRLESAATAFYRATASKLGAGDAAGLFRELAGQHETRRQLLERTRQQKLNEMVLEPISGLDGSRYVVDETPAGPSGVRALALAIEGVSMRFYHESSAVARSFLTEATRTFDKLAEENARNVRRLEEALSA